MTASLNNQVQDDTAEQDVDLQAILFEVKDNLKVLLAESKGSVHSMPLPLLKGHPAQLTQLFQNLIGNSLKFRKHGVAPLVNISCLRTEYEFIIRLSDEGTGISKKNIQKISRIFQRLGSSKSFEGIGNGLAQADQIMSSMGGSIDIESLYGLRTTVILRFPLNRVGSTLPSTS